MFQMSAVGPTNGQAMFFQRIAAPKGIISEYAIERYINDRLVDRDYLCGDYSIVNISMFTWARAFRWGNIEIGGLRHLKAWFERIEARDAVQRGIRVPTGKPPPSYNSEGDLTEATRRNAERYDA
jgi:GST-like protein